MPLIEARDVVKEYKVGRVVFEALRHLNLEVREGEFLCIMGPSGSGKTTLLNLLGLLDVPTSGEIFLDGRTTLSLSYREAAQMRRQKLGFIFQSFNLFPVLNAFENIEYPLLFFPMTSGERQRRVWEALNDVQLQEIALHRPDEMSGGQQQRVAIARAVVTQPRVILADEPTAHLDHESAEAILTTMRRLNERHRCTFIFSTHDPRVIRYASRITRLSDGKIENEDRMAPVANLLEKRLSQ